MPDQNPQGAQQAQGGGIGRYLFPLLVFLVLNNTLRKKEQPVQPVGQSTPQRAQTYLPQLHPGQALDYNVVIKVGEEIREAWALNAVNFGEADTVSPANRETTLNFSLTATDLQQNSSVSAIISVSRTGASRPTVTTDVPLVVYKKRRNKNKKNLLSAETAVVEPVKETDTFVSYFKPSLSFCLVEDWSPVSKSQLPAQMVDSYQFDEESSTYKPILFVNEFWLLSEHLVELNDTENGMNVSLRVALEPVGLIKWQLLSQMEQSFAAQTSMGLNNGHDEIKRMLLETNPYLLALTFVVTMLHSLFDMLAFKNDIAFWKNKKDVKGLSVRSIMMNTVCQLIIFLYLLDNETSWVVLISSGVGVLIEGWKIKKACNITIDRGGMIPKIRISDKTSYSDATRTHDETAVRWMSYILAPCVVGYAVYSVIYQEHKSWYSFILNTLVGFIYTFGFIMMTPQLFINYKMKSVAHLPWKTFTYKALNTFIDDLFAFIIKMPTLHRLSCFRDDLIFFIYLYQRWIYPVDVNRTNEFGQGGDKPAEPAELTEPKPKEE